jgi:hypothetical protein
MSDLSWEKPMSGSMRIGIRIFSGLALAGISFCSPALADVEIMASSIPEYAPGAVLKDDTRLKLPEGATLRVLMTDSGTTKTMYGPYEGTAAAYRERRSWWERLFGTPGGKEPVLGGTRRVKPEE